MATPRLILPLAGAFATAVIAVAGTWAHGPALIARLETRSAEALARAGAPAVQAEFITAGGWLTRHPTLSGGAGLGDAQRLAAAQAVAAVRGVGGVQWRREAARGAALAAAPDCTSDVAAILKTRTIRFAEGSARIDADSAELLDEVAAALRPCRGGIVAVEGHTDAQGSEPDNVALSLERARAVREALIARGIARDDLRARGLGSARPLTGLEAADPANRRIEFFVISPAPQKATLVDQPDAG